MPALRSLILRLETLVITEHTHSEHNDWQEPGGEQLSVSETSTPQPVQNAPAQEEGQTTEASSRSEELPAAVVEEVVVAMSDEKQTASVDESAVEAVVEAPAVENVPLTIASVVAEEIAAIAADGDIRQPNLLEGESPALFPAGAEAPLSPEEAVRPFTDFIEEFRQTEGYFGPPPDTSFTAFVMNNENLHEPVGFVGSASDSQARVVEIAPFQLDLGTLVPEAAAGGEVNATPANQPEETPPGLTQPRLAPERPVSPLLRPAGRPRGPRHSRHRIDELIHPAELRGEALKAPLPAPAPL